MFYFNLANNVNLYSAQSYNIFLIANNFINIF